MTHVFKTDTWIGPNEQNSNSENFIAAMTRQGGANYNILTNRVWWDVK